MNFGKLEIQSTFGRRRSEHAQQKGRRGDYVFASWGNFEFQRVAFRVTFMRSNRCDKLEVMGPWGELISK